MDTADALWIVAADQLDAVLVDAVLADAVLVDAVLADAVLAAGFEVVDEPLDAAEELFAVSEEPCVDEVDDSDLAETLEPLLSARASLR